MPWDAAAFNARLKEATTRYNRVAAANLCQELIEHLLGTDDAYPPREAAAALQALRNKRMFALMRRVGDAFLQTGRASLRLRRLYAQALIDEGNLTAALAVLQDLVALSADDREENAEARGLIGRVHKQLYVNTAGYRAAHRQKHLELAIRAYLEVYETAPADRLWHGINGVALLARAARDQVSCNCGAEPGALARQILARIEDKGETATMWDFGTAFEACLALGDWPAAQTWLARYLASPFSDAFELGSTLRQLTEVWQLNLVAEPGRSILPVLSAELLDREGGCLEMTGDELQHAAPKLDPAAYEKVFGVDSYKTYRWFQTGLQRAQLVARIGRNAEQGHGTGFLLKGSDLAPHYGDDLVLLTNAHVVSGDEAVRKAHQALPPGEAVITFETHGPEEYEVAELLWSSPPAELDATILRLDKIDGLTAKLAGLLAGIAKNLPVVDDAARVYVIGHPKGGTLSFSLQDNLLLDHESPHIHYRAPTESGSSGSPVFNAKWDLIGLHHAGKEDMPRLNKKDGTYPANEGIWLRAIIAAIPPPNPAG